MTTPRTNNRPTVCDTFSNFPLVYLINYRKLAYVISLLTDRKNMYRLQKAMLLYVDSTHTNAWLSVKQESWQGIQHAMTFVQI